MQNDRRLTDRDSHAQSQNQKQVAAKIESKASETRALFVAALFNRCLSLSHPLLISSHFLPSRPGRPQSRHPYIRTTLLCIVPGACACYSTACLALENRGTALGTRSRPLARLCLVHINFGACLFLFSRPRVLSGRFAFTVTPASKLWLNLAHSPASPSPPSPCLQATTTLAAALPTLALTLTLTLTSPAKTFQLLIRLLGRSGNASHPA